MIDFASALYLGMRHPSDGLGPFSALTTGTPASLADARTEAARKTPVDRAKYQTIRTLEELKAWKGPLWIPLR